MSSCAATGRTASSTPIVLLAAPSQSKLAKLSTIVGHVCLDGSRVCQIWHKAQAWTTSTSIPGRCPPAHPVETPPQHPVQAVPGPCPARWQFWFLCFGCYLLPDPRLCHLRPRCHLLQQLRPKRPRLMQHLRLADLQLPGAAKPRSSAAASPPPFEVACCR